MGIYNLDFVKELVNAFNINNYGSEVNTNFVVKGNNIIVNFNCDQSSAKRCLSQVARGLVREYFADEYVASHFFDLKSFPFCFNEEWLDYDKKTDMTKLIVPIDSRVIFNLKVHFVEEFEIDVKTQVIEALSKKSRYNKKHIEEALNSNINSVQVSGSSRYIKCLLFHDQNVQEFFEKTLKTRMEEYGYGYLDFYHVDGNKIYFKDVENIGFIRSVTELSKKKTGYHFRFPSSHDLKVRNYKDVMGELIFRLTGIPICGYYRDSFIDGDRISNGERYAFVPMVKDGSHLRHLDYIEANKVNTKFSYDLLTNIRGQTEGTRSDGFGEVYAFSDRQIALLIPVIIENSVINKDGQLEIDPELPQRLQSPEPSPLRELSQIQVSPKRNQEEPIRESPRQPEKEKGTGVLYHTIGSGNLPQQSSSAAAVGAGKSVQGAGGKVDNETKKEILENFIHVLPHQNNQKFWLKMLSSLSSPEEVEKLYSDLSSPCGREKLYPKFHLSSERCKWMEFEWRSQLSIALKEQTDLSQQPVSAAAAGADGSVQGASGGFSASLTPGKSSGKHSKVKSKVDESGSKSPKKHEALQSEGSPSKRADELEQGASGGSRKLSFSDKAKKCASRVMERLKFRRDDKRRASIRSTPEERTSEQVPVSPTYSLPGTVRESSPLLEDSPVHLKDISWQLSEVVEESAPPVEDKSRLGVPVHRNDSKSSQKSDDNGFKSGLSSRASLDAVTLAKLEQCRENEVVEQTHL